MYHVIMMDDYNLLYYTFAVWYDVTDIFAVSFL